MLSEVTSITIDYAGHSQNFIRRVLSSSMPLLETITFQKYHLRGTSPSISTLQSKPQQILSVNILRVIFQEDYFSRLKELNLVGCNIDDSWLDFIDEKNIKNRNIRLEVLKLGKIIDIQVAISYQARCQLHQHTTTFTI